MGAEVAKISWPPFGSRDRRGVDDELISLNIESSGGLDALHVRPMADFGLSIGAHNFHLTLEGNPFFLLFLSHHVLDGERKHGVVEDTHVLPKVSISPDSLVALMLLEPFSIDVELLGTLELLHVVDPHFLLGHIVELMSVLQNRITLHKLKCVIKSSDILLVEYSLKTTTLGFVEVALISLLLEVGCDNFIFPGSRSWLLLLRHDINESKLNL